MQRDRVVGTWSEVTSWYTAGWNLNQVIWLHTLYFQSLASPTADILLGSGRIIRDLLISRVELSSPPSPCRSIIEPGLICQREMQW